MRCPCAEGVAANVKQARAGREGDGRECAAVGEGCRVDRGERSIEAHSHALTHTRTMALAPSLAPHLKKQKRVFSVVIHHFLILHRTGEITSTYEDAIQNYREALTIKPDYAEAYNNLGNVLLDQGALDESINE